MHVCLSASVHASSTLSTQYLESVGCIFTKLSVLVHSGTRMNTSGFGSEVQGHGGPACWKMYFLVLLT